MNKQAYFFINDALLLPADWPDSRIDMGLSLELAREFDGADVFEIPAIDEAGAVINAVSVLPGSVLPGKWKTVPIRALLNKYSVEGGIDRIAKIVRACHIAQWRRDSSFCGTCGSKNGDVPGQACRCCPACGRLEFPRICPAAIVIITDNENRILLAHNKRFRAGLYSLISGFTEAGESLEETVVREIREEVNIEVNRIEYVKSQTWPFPNSLMVGFKARYASGTIKPDGEEIEDAKWFTKDNLPELPGEGSLSRVLINNWIQS